VADRFAVGEVYFRVTYPGPSLNYPLVESFVFVGRNLSEEDAEDTWYFQFADSFAEFGSILAGRGGDRRVRCLAANELDEMLDTAKLAVELEAATARRLAR
jgi:hypothetical protein